MRKLQLFCIVFFLFTTFSIAQDTLYLQNLQKDRKIHISGFGGILSETTLLKKSLAESLGAGGALLFNNFIYLGGYAMGMSSNFYIKDLIMPTPDSMLYHGTPLRINYSHAGFWLGGVFFPEKRFHLGISTRIGWGHIYLTEKYNTSYINNENYRLEYTNDKVFVATPQLEFDVKITNWLKFNLGVGYRFIKGIDFDRYKEYKFNSPQVTLGLYFGGFSRDTDTNYEFDEMNE